VGEGLLKVVAVPDSNDLMAPRTRGFIVSDFYPERLLPIRAELAALLRAKQLRVAVSEFQGLERAPEALATVSTAAPLYRQAGRPDLGGVGRAVTPARDA
jgi:hypothetical protein